MSGLQKERFCLSPLVEKPRSKVFKLGNCNCNRTVLPFSWGSVINILVYGGEWGMCVPMTAPFTCRFSETPSLKLCARTKQETLMETEAVPLLGG